MLRKFATPVLVLALAVLGRAQTSDELRERFGKPVAETFSAQSGVSLAVAYAGDGQSCEMVIEPPRSVIHSENAQARVMPTAAISKLIGELVPTNTRGDKVMDWMEFTGCIVIRTTQYTHVTIVRSQDNCNPDSANRDCQIAITFKDRTCAGR